MSLINHFKSILNVSKIRNLPAKDILLNASRFSQVENEFKEQLKSSKNLKISVLSTLSSQHFLSVLKLFLYAEGIVPEFYASEYDGIYTEGLDLNSKLWNSDPDVLIVLPALNDIKTWPRMFANQEELDMWVNHQSQIYKKIWDLAKAKNPSIRIYQGLFIPPIQRQLGNLEKTYSFSKTNCLQKLNNHLQEIRSGSITLVDLDSLSSLIGRLNWFDETSYFHSKQGIAIREIPYAASYIARLIAADQGFVRKCLALDLDNTLWGGVIGDDGLTGIRLSPTDPVGEAYLAFQKYILDLKERGVLLAICSKNDETTARSAFEMHEDMLIRMSDISVFKANWDDKATNLRRIANELNIGIDSIVFFDDNPAERSIVEQHEPDVFVINVPEDPAQFVRALDLSFAFEWPQLTEEDTSRAASYIQNQMRQQLEEKHIDYNHYLQSLQMAAWIEPTSNESVTRVSQLINKTNQFNLRTKRYSEENLNLMISSTDFQVVHVRFKDQFTNFGIIASFILQFSGKMAFIDNWVMSCRVFKRGLEDAIFNAILEILNARPEVEYLVAEYIETPKSNYVSSLLDNLGLKRIESEIQDWPFGNCTGVIYKSPVSELKTRKHFIELASTKSN